MHRIAIPLTTLLVAFALSACSLMPKAPQPKTPTELLAYVDATITATADTTTEALEAGRIDAGTARQVLEELDRSSALADEARNLIEAGDTATAEGRLRLAESILLRIERRLAEENAE